MLTFSRLKFQKSVYNYLFSTVYCILFLMQFMCNSVTVKEVLHSYYSPWIWLLLWCGSVGLATEGTLVQCHSQKYEFLWTFRFGCQCEMAMDVEHWDDVKVFLCTHLQIWEGLYVTRYGHGSSTFLLSEPLLGFITWKQKQKKVQVKVTYNFFFTSSHQHDFHSWLQF